MTEDGLGRELVADELLSGLGDRSHRLSLRLGEILVRRGDESDSVFLVESGSLDAIDDSSDGDVVVGTLREGQVAGEITVIAGGRRTATLRATEPTVVNVIDRTSFEQWLVDHPAATDAVSSQARERIDRGQVAAMVAAMVGHDEGRLVQQIVDRVTWRHLAPGEILFEQGDVSDAAYFVVGGRVRVSAVGPDGDDALAELGRGEVVGELGLLDDAPRSATVRAVRDTTLAVFSRDVFEELVTTSPALMLHVARGILTRLRRTPRRLVGRASSLTIAVTAPVESEPIVAGVVAAIVPFGTVRHLSSDRVDSYLSRAGIAQAEADNVGVPRLAEFMHEADVGNDHVILEADRGLTGWTRRALRQADRAVIVCSPRPDAAERAEIRSILDALAELDHVSQMLAVVHPAGTSRPLDTAALLDELGVDEVVHLRDGNAADVARLGRLASGNGIGLVLSGGGARGFAHLGVYRALMECGIPIDAVGGCSIGAPLAAGIAREMPLPTLIVDVQRQFHRLLDYTIPVVSLVRGARISASIEDTLGGWDIEDLWLPYYCVSTNLTRSQLVVHRRGNLVRAVRASVAIPGVLPPVPSGDDLLVDGGVLNNMPFEPMRRDGRIDTVIAVDVAPERGPRAKADYGLSVSGVRALVASARRKSEYPSVTAVLLRSMLAGSVSNQKTALRGADAVDLLLDLDCPGVGLLDFERVAEVADIGYHSSLEAIRAWATTRPWLGSAT